MLFKKIKGVWVKRVCNTIFATLLSLGCLLPHVTLAAFSTIAFYYGSHIPWRELKAYDVVVVQPNVVRSPKQYRSNLTQLAAYVSIGQVAKSADYYAKIPKDWLLAEDKNWGSEIIDQTNSQWQTFFIEDIIRPLWNKGYRLFFLDTVDAYQAVAKTNQAKQAQQAALTALILRLKTTYPKAKIIINRGFELLPAIHQVVTAITVESLFQTWTSKDKKYVAMRKQASQQLLTILKAINARYQLPIIVIDYVDPDNRLLAQQTAKKIKALGFIPWVADVNLTSVGASSVEVVPRNVLMLYDTKNVPNASLTEASRFAAMPLENMGYEPIYHNVDEPLPDEIMRNRYAGIVLWLSSDESGSKQSLQKWLVKQKQQGVPIAILGTFGFPITAASVRPFGLAVPPLKKKVAQLNIGKLSPLMGFETNVFVNRASFVPLIAPQSNVLLEINDKHGNKEDAAAITAWGGYVLSPYVRRLFPNNQTRWIISPFPFLKQALRLQSFPQPDVTTENGRRLMLVHIDGDGFISKAEWPDGHSAGEEARKLILDKFRVPTTVSIIQGELSPSGRVTNKNREFIETARKIFNMPWVELATHTYSHPFKWRELEKQRSGENMNMVLHDYANLTAEQLARVEGGDDVEKLNLPGYQFSAKKEIEGSAQFINQVLAPANKRTKVVLWSGDCNPSGNVVKGVYDAGLYNMNYGDTILLQDKNSLTNISPLGIDKQGYYQIFAPNQNENVYTNNWTGPFYGFERVIETFKLTDKPYRYKPIDIYYHFYAVSKRSSYKSLKHIYEWALSQKVFNIFASEYIQKVLDWRQTVIAREGNAWIIRHNGTMRELRVKKSMGYPDLTRSQNIIGFSAYNDYRYIHLGPNETSHLRLIDSPPSLPYLVEANAFVRQFQRTATGINFHLQGYRPIIFTLANVNHCRLLQGDKVIAGNADDGGDTTYQLTKRDSNELRLLCQA